MSSVDDRLRALDPFAGASYEHPDAAAMVARITARDPRTPRRHRGRAVVLAPVAAVLAAGLSVGGLLVAAGTSSPLPALAIRAPSPAVSGAPLQKSVNGLSYLATAGHVGAAYFGSEDTSALSGTLAAAADATGVPAFAAYGLSVPAPTGLTYQYELGAALPELTPTTSSVRVLAPAVPRALLARGAAALGVHAAVAPLGHGALRVAARLGRSGWSTLTLRTVAGLGVLTYATTTTPTDVAGCVSALRSSRALAARRDAMAATLARLVSTLDVPYQLGPPSVVAQGTRPGCAPGEVVVDQVRLDGTATDELVAGAFSPLGRLEEASVPVFRLAAVAAYPLVSPAAAAASLVQRTAGADAVGTAHASSTTHRPDVVVVELRAVALGLRAFTTTSGATWFLPVYELRGDGYAEAPYAGPATWSGVVLATSPSAVRLGRAATGVFDERP